MPRSFVPLAYLKVLLPAFQCETFGDSMNIEIRITPYMMSGLVAIKYIMLPTTLLNNVSSTVDPSSSLFNFKHVIIGVGGDLQLKTYIEFF